MFFGMCNSPVMFQAMMDSIFDDIITGTIIIVYMDDMFVFEKELPTLIENTKKVLQRLRDNDLYLNPKKCEFHKTKIKYLGMVIKEGKVSMDTSKLKGIQDWPIPTTVKQVRGFLGFGNFYRRFICNFSDIAQPLNELLKMSRFDYKSYSADGSEGSLMKRLNGIITIQRSPVRSEHGPYYSGPSARSLHSPTYSARTDRTPHGLRAVRTDFSSHFTCVNVLGVRTESE